MEFMDFIKEINSHHIIGIVGDLGDGKSISGIAIIGFLKMFSDLTKNPKAVISNIPTSYNKNPIIYYDELNNLENKILFIDEIHLLADSRNSHGKSNFFTAGITTDVRKRKNKMIWTSQETSQVEKRVRNRTTLFVNPVNIYELIFKLTFVSKTQRFLGDITLNLNVFKNDYSTHYVPQPLLNRDDEEK